MGKSDSILAAVSGRIGALTDVFGSVILAVAEVDTPLKAPVEAILDTGETRPTTFTIDVKGRISARGELALQLTSHDIFKDVAEYARCIAGDSVPIGDAESIDVGRFFAHASAFVADEAAICNLLADVACGGSTFAKVLARRARIDVEMCNVVSRDGTNSNIVMNAHQLERTCLTFVHMILRFGLNLVQADSPSEAPVPIEAVEDPDFGVEDRSADAPAIDTRARLGAGTAMMPGGCSRDNP